MDTSSYSYKTSVTHLLEQLQLESLEERRKVQRLAFMYTILNGQVAVPAASVDLILSSRLSRGTDTNQQKLITVRSHTENYKQSYSIRTVKDWNSLPQSVVSAGSLASFKSRLTSHAAPWLHSPSVWCPCHCQGPCRLLIQIQILVERQFFCIFGDFLHINAYNCSTSGLKADITNLFSDSEERASSLSEALFEK